MKREFHKMESIITADGEFRNGLLHGHGIFSAPAATGWFEKGEYMGPEKPENEKEN